ncbi:FAD-dependent oxidoreductase [Massilia sp. CF038]|uniref:FAD-dependent oxidoreductase n=1 Tax=Massilia sp. CF038 TaxID=1881045 RepID=UPI0009150724|nr:FAD-dependent oxidoreductase [Massilia sp. CF038]SHG75561.1 2-polyprenyl-6-methoxyphenol hydroxylase [Massilia sp. CF038]
MKYDVIIAGAGPVGLFLACELALARCAVLVLEKAADPVSPFKQFPFGIRGLSAPTLEALDRRDLLNALDTPQRRAHPFSKEAQAQAPRQAGHFAGIGFNADRIDSTQWPYRLPTSTPTSLMSEMAALEAVLTDRAAQLGVDIKRGQAVTAISQSEDAVTVFTDSAAFGGRWLVGCDGARSAVRKAGRFTFAGTEPSFTGYSIKADLADPSVLAPGRNLTSNGMYFQSQPGFLVMQQFDGGAAHDTGLCTLEHVQAVLRRVSNSNATIAALHTASTWTDRARQATEYRDGRILLAGDAAHIHAPLGGQGLNLGLGDAMNLGWKLAATVHGTAAPGLLDSYQRERHPIGMRVLDWSRAQAVLMTPTPEANALRAIVSDLMQTVDGATYIAGRVWGIGTRLDLGDGHPLDGHSVPNFALDTGATVGELLRDGRALLLDFGGLRSGDALVRGYRGQIRYLAARAHDQLGLGALLIRPDGIVAWACDAGVDTGTLAHVVARYWLPER